MESHLDLDQCYKKRHNMFLTRRHRHLGLSISVLTDFIFYCCVKITQPWGVFTCVNTNTVTTSHWAGTSDFQNQDLARGGRERRKCDNNKRLIPGWKLWHFLWIKVWDLLVKQRMEERPQLHKSQLNSALFWISFVFLFFFRR